MTATCTNTVSAPVKTHRTSVAQALATALTRLSTALQVKTQRRTLAQLDDARLEDLGLSFDQARSEAARPFWDVPAHWKN